MTNRLRGIIWLAVVFIIAGIFVVQYVMAPTNAGQHLDYKEFYQKLESNQIETFHAYGLAVSGKLTNGQSYATEIPNRDTPFVNDVMHHVRGSVTWEGASTNSFLPWLITFVPLVAFAFILYVILRQARGRGGPPFR